VATIDPDGYMQITDRSKDVIKSGGEWISSIDVENIAVAHPAVAMAACIGIKHPKWDERPIIAVVKKPGSEVTRDELLAFYEGKIAKWQIPMTWCLSTPFRWAAPARCKRPSCAKC
jgi:acyl-CoA synthetase (AMP-forming)/AMP-acid ligase II